MLSKSQRLEIIFERLQKASPCSSREQANKLVCDIVNSVELEYTGLPNDYNANSGRMFFYSFDLGFWENLDSDPASLDLNRKHVIELYHSGKIIIYVRNGNSLHDVFRKNGLNEGKER